MNPARGQRLLEPSHTPIRDPGVVEIKDFKACQSLQPREPGIRNVNVAERKIFQARQSLQVNQPSIGDLSVIERRLPVHVVYFSTQSLDRRHRPPLPFCRHYPQAQSDAEQRNNHEDGAQRDLQPTTFWLELGEQADHAFSMRRATAAGKSGPIRRLQPRRFVGPEIEAIIPVGPNRPAALPTPGQRGKRRARCWLQRQIGQD